MVKNGFIKLQKVTKTVRTGSQEQIVLDHIDLEISQGDIALIFGPSGSGKTTLLNQIGAIDRPDEGTIIVNGVNITQMKEKELTTYRSKFIGWIFQFYNLIPSLTTIENVALGLELAGQKKDVMKKSEQMLSLVGLADHMDKFPSQLSGGQQQRVAIARALAKSPQVVLGDEITGNLDSKTGKDIISLIKSLNEELGSTFLLVSHDLGLKEFATKIVELRDGRIEQVFER